METLHQRIRNDIARQCSTVMDHILHTHSVLTTDVIKAIKHLKTDKYNDDGVLMSNNFQNSTQ